MSERKEAHEMDGGPIDPANVPSGQDVGPPGARVDDETPVSKDASDEAKQLRRQE